MEMKRVHISVDEQTLSAIKRIAKRDGASMSATTRRLVREGVRLEIQRVKEESEGERARTAEEVISAIGT